MTEFCFVNTQKLCLICYEQIDLSQNNSKKHNSQSVYEVLGKSIHFTWQINKIYANFNYRANFWTLI